MMDASATTQAIFEAWNSRDFEKFYSYFAEDYVFESVAAGVSSKGKAEFKALMDGALQAFPDLTFEDKGTITSGNKATSEYVMSGTQKGEFVGMPPTGKRFAMRCCSIVEFEGGLFKRETAYADMATMMRQLGHMPSSA